MAILTASNDISDWGGAFGLDTDVSRFDNTRVPYSIIMANNTLTVMRGPHPAPSSDTVWYHFRLRSGGAWGSADDGFFARIKALDTTTLCVLDTANGLIAVQSYGDTTATGTYVSGPAANTFIDVDLSVQVNASNVITTLYLNGTVASTATVSNTSGGVGIARYFEFDVNDTNGFYMSEFIVADTDTRGMRLSRLKPTADGNYTAYVGGFADVSDDNPATGVQSGTATDRESYTFPTYSLANAITAVVVTSSASVTGAGPTQIAQSLRVGTTDYDGSAITLSAAQLLATEVWALDPSDSGAWTAAKINACESGFLAIA